MTAIGPRKGAFNSTFSLKSTNEVSIANMSSCPQESLDSVTNPQDNVNVASKNRNLPTNNIQDYPSPSTAAVVPTNPTELISLETNTTETITDCVSLSTTLMDLKKQVAELLTKLSKSEEERVNLLSQVKNWKDRQHK